jgi:endonuclease G, mitochondrial
MVAAAQHAISSGTDVMFMCMGNFPRPMIEAVARLAYERGVIWVCAAGNEVESVVAPAMYPGTIAVAAFNPDYKPWRGSSNGPAVDIAAPGEAVYVPIWDKDGNENMCYGNGTSYATPHVAAAAMLWKARHKKELSEKYREPWQIVEAFRKCLKDSANDLNKTWKKDKYGAGVLDIEKLLAQKLPDLKKEDHAYFNKPAKPHWDLGIIETAHFLWNTLRRKLTPGPEEAALTDQQLSSRGRTALNVLIGSTKASAVESTGSLSDAAKKKILTEYLESHQ